MYDEQTTKTRQIGFYQDVNIKNTPETSGCRPTVVCQERTGEHDDERHCPGFGQGRRTLYTYFKSKEDIYYAVIESELERLSDQLDEVAAKRIPPQEKIIELIYLHLSMIRETVVRNGNLRAEFFRNIWMVEKVRKNFDDDEIALFRKVFREGKEDGEFDIDNVDLVADITHYCIKGLEVPYIYGRIAHGMTAEATKPQVAKIVYSALGKRKL